jgi:hypothetical protein
MNRVVLCLSAFAALLVSAPAAHAAGWASTGPLSPEGKVATDPQVALTPSGERIAAWIERGPTGGSGPLVVRTAPPAGDFGPPQKFDGAFEAPQLVAGRDGTVGLGFIDAQARAVRIARRAPGQTSFTEAPALAPAPTEFPFPLNLAVSGGDVWVGFSSFAQGNPSTSSVWVARLAAGANAAQIVPGTAAGGAIERASFTNGTPHVFVQSSSFAVDDGRATIAWDNSTTDNGNANSTTTLKVARGSATGLAAPTPITTLTGFGPTFAPQSSVRSAAGGGHAYVAFVTTDGKLVYEDLADGRILTVPSDTRFPHDLESQADSSGALVLAWDATPDGLNNSLVATVTVPPGALPPTASHVTRVGPERQLDDLAVAADGTALVLPDHSSGGFDTTVQIDGSLRPAGGAFGDSEPITGQRDRARFGQHQAAAAVLPGGRALAAFPASDDSGTANQRIEVSERDTAPPALGTIAVPSTATVGQRAGFAATAGDILSGTTISWDFGDGSQADGGVVDHVYGQPGPAVVTITATDEAGNSTSEQRVVAVQPATGAGPTGPAADTTAPVLSKASVTHKRFRVTRRGTAQIAASKRKPKRAPAGTALRFSVSERSTLAIAIERRKIVRGTLVRASAGPGRVTVPFTGRIGRTALAPGSYTATITAIDGAGNRSRAVHVKFSVSK